MARHDRVGELGERAVRLRDRVADLEAAAAVVRIEQRKILARDDVTGRRHAQRREQHPRVAVRVPTAHVVELDLIGPLEQRHAVLERALRQAFPAVLLEDIRRRRRARLAEPRHRLHRLHIGRGVFLDDDVDRRREFDVAAHVIAMRVRVDDCRHRLRTQLLDFFENRRAPSGVLGVDDGDAVGLDENRGVAAAARQDEQVVLELLHLDDHRLLAALLRDDVRDRAGGDQDREHCDAFHTAPPEKKTRCTNQNTPASITMMEPANASRRPAASLRDRIHTNNEATSTTKTSWPISTPTLNAKSVQPSARLGKSISRRTFAKPNPCISPNAKAIQARVSRPPALTSRLSAPT